MQCALSALLGLLVLGCLLRVAAAGGGFLVGAATSEAGCVANGEACQEGVDCCGVCAYIGAETWRCQACTPLGEECIPMHNRCCDGGDRQKDVHLSQPKHACKATDELSSRFGTTKYACQAAALHEPDNVTMPAVAPEVVPQPSAEQQGSEERAESNECTPDGEACKDGVDCCGVCAYIGAETWRCQSCTPLGEECIPMGNRCCDGGDRQKDVHLSQPKHACKATDELSSRFGTTKYTCQAAALHEPDNVTMPAVAPEVVPQPSAEQQGSEERAESNQCIPNGEVCKLGVDCCGVCVFMGRGSGCRTCVAPGGACFDPYSNPCCGGATKRYDQGIVDPAYTCQSTGQKVGVYGIEQYTCQPAKP